jgi:hypothetical protein
LLAALKIKEERVIFDSAAIDFHQLNFQRLQLTNQNYPFWDTSRTMTLLAEDINGGLYQLFMPIQLRNNQPEYHEFPLDVFCQHIHQEKRCLVQ